MVRRRPRRWSLRSGSSQAETSASAAGKASEASQRAKERKIIFRAALEGELQRREIATQIQRAGGINANDLRALAEQFDDVLWEPAEADQQLAEAFDEELQRLQRRLQIPAMRAIHNLIAYPYLQAVATIAGLLLVVSSFGSKLLQAAGASGWSRILFSSGVTMLGFALVDCIACYLNTRAGRPVGPAIRPLLTVLTGLGAAAFGVVEANGLAEYHTEAQLAFWMLLLTDGAVVAAMIYRRVSASSVEREAETRSIHEPRRGT